MVSLIYYDSVMATVHLLLALNGCIIVLLLKIPVALVVVSKTSSPNPDVYSYGHA